MTDRKTQRIPAKLLLFGEHTILRGSQALAMPLWTRGCEWKTEGTPAQQGGLPGLLTYLKASFAEEFDLQQLEQDLQQGHYLESDIPVGYGLGSSAALCVAVFERYATQQGQALLAQLGPKSYFARLESHFHGTSSGTDPLIIYKRSNILLLPDGTNKTVGIPPLPSGWNLFLLDTKQARETASLVNYFTDTFDNDRDFRQKSDFQWVHPTNDAIEALLAAKPEALWTAFRRISGFQYQNLPPMVIPQIRDIWLAGMTSHTFLLKICGAGGGGYCLGLTSDWEATQSMASQWPLELVEW